MSKSTGALIVTLIFVIVALFNISKQLNRVVIAIDEHSYGFDDVADRVVLRLGDK